DAICLRDREFFYSINIIVSGEDAPFQVVLQISAIFDLSDVENAVFSNNIKEKGTHILTSFARPIIMDIVVKAGYPPLVIPYSDNE
ncbi:MAG: protein-export chaperone SecB, partial [Pseudobutyrivibrio sp.]|nr:protein-export chaperone SecB [Pseudobutyrivibrio sp.]